MTVQKLGEFAFNKNQLRGPDGRWIRVGTVVRSSEHGKGVVRAIDKDTDKATVAFDDPDSDTGEKRVKVKASTLRTVDPPKPLTPQEKAKRSKRLNDIDSM